MNVIGLFEFKLPIDLASAIVGFLLAVSLYLFDKSREPKVSIQVSNPSDLKLSQGEFKSLNLKVSNKNYSGVLKFLNRTITQARIILTFRDYPTNISLEGLDNVSARWNSSREPTTPDYDGIDIGLALLGSREVIVPGEETTISVVIKKRDWSFCYPFNNESYIYQQKNDFKRPGWQINNKKFYVEVTLQAAEVNRILGLFIVLNEGSLEQFKIDEVKN